MAFQPDQQGFRRSRQPPLPGNDFDAQPRAQRLRGRWERSRLMTSDGDRLARGLGLFSIGLGVAQLVAPRGMSRLVGMQEHPALMRLIGAREIASGLGILGQRRPAGWVWARVAGDTMDIALLLGAMRPGNPGRHRAARALTAVAGVTALDLLCSEQLTRSRHAVPSRVAEGIVHVEKSLALNRPPEECYRFWHDFENFPRFMHHLESVQITGPNRSHWVAKGPLGRKVEWDSEVTEDRPNELIAWRSLPDSQVRHAGTVRFEPHPAGRGTIVRVSMEYEPPGGPLGALTARFFGEEPDHQIQEDLRRFKQVLETGEIATTRGQPSGRRSLLARATREGRKSSPEGKVMS